MVAPGGLCWILFFKWEDVLVWPLVDPQQSLITSDIQLKPGASYYVLKGNDKGRMFEENPKKDTAGPYHEQIVTAPFPENNAAITLSLQTMQFHRFGIILKEKNGDLRLIGNEDAGAELDFNYSSGDNSSSRKRVIRFSYQHHLTAPFYNGTNIILDNSLVPLGSGNTTNTYEMKLIQRFKVGEPGAPMLPGAEVYNAPSNALAGKEVIVFASGVKIAEYSDPMQRHVVKNIGDNYLTIAGGVMKDEIIEIYTIS